MSLDNDWKLREANRMRSGEYKLLSNPQIDSILEAARQEILYSDAALRIIDSYLHISKLNPAHVAWTPDDDWGQRDKQKSGKLSSFLAATFPELPSEVIGKLQQQYLGQTDTVDCVILTGYAIVAAYKDGPSSCMSHKNWEFLGPDQHPCDVYAECPDVGLAVVYNESGRISSRSLVNIPAKLYARPYGSMLVASSLEKIGYRLGSNVLDGVKLPLIRSSAHPDAIICPYVDGDGRVDVHPGCLLVTSEGAYNTHCFIGGAPSGLLEEFWTPFGPDYSVCTSCGDAMHVDDLIYVNCEDLYLCQSCANSDYVLAYVDRTHMEWRPADDAYYYEVTDRYYTIAALCDHDLCIDVHGDTVNINDVVEYDGDYYLYDALHDACLVLLVDGDVCHEDDAFEYDGSFYHTSEMRARGFVETISGSICKSEDTFEYLGNIYSEDDLTENNLFVTSDGEVLTESEYDNYMKQLTLELTNHEPSTGNATLQTASQ